MSEFIRQALLSDILRPYLGLFATILALAALFDIVFFVFVVRWIRRRGAN